MAAKFTRRNLIKAGVAAGLAAGAASIPFINISYSSAGRNIILVICDAFRFDRLGRMREVNGIQQSLTPYMDTLALEGMTFLNAKSPSTFTAVSMLSLIYDAQPTGILYTGWGTKVAGPYTHIARRLKDAGYVTLMACANDILSMDSTKKDFDDTTIIMPSRESWDREGQFRAGAPQPEISGPKLNARASRILDKRRKEISSKPLFFQVHYMDTHQPYNAAGFKPAFALNERIYPYIVNQALEEKRRFYPDRRTTVKQAVDYLIEYYDSASLALDGFLRELFAQLAERKILDDALVIITADHGEEFADNKEIDRKHVGHSGPMDEEMIHVPLIVWTRGSAEYYPPGRKIANQVSSVRVVNDIIADYARGDKGEYSQLRAALDAGSYPDHPVVSALNWSTTKTNEASCIFRQKEGYFKYRAFYKDNGVIAAEKAFTIGADRSLAKIEVTDEIRQAANKGFKNQRPMKAVIDKESEDKLKALGYHNG